MPRGAVQLMSSLCINNKYICNKYAKLELICIDIWVGGMGGESKIKSVIGAQSNLRYYRRHLNYKSTSHYWYVNGERQLLNNMQGRVY